MFLSVVQGQKLNENFTFQLKTLIDAVKKNSGKLKGEKISEDGEYKCTLPLDGFSTIYYNNGEPVIENISYVYADKAVKTEESGDWMKAIATALKKLPGYTLKYSWIDKAFFEGRNNKTMSHTLVLAKGEDWVVSVVETNDIMTTKVSIQFH